MRRDEVRIGASIPGITLRVLNVAVVVATAVVLQPAPFWQVLFVIVALAGSVFSRSGLAWLALLVAPLALVLDDVSLWRTAVAVFAVHLGHVLTTLALVVPARSSVALRALTPTLRRFVGVQLAAQAVAMAAIVMVRGGGPEHAWLAPVGACAIVLLTLVLVRRPR